MFLTETEILKEAEAWRREGRGVAIATVVETWGSAPRPVGSHLVIDEDTNFLGSVSGGCVEGAVITEALDVIAASGWDAKRASLRLEVSASQLIKLVAEHPPAMVMWNQERARLGLIALRRGS